MSTIYHSRDIPFWSETLEIHYQINVIITVIIIIIIIIINIVIITAGSGVVNVFMKSKKMFDNSNIFYLLSYAYKHQK